MYCAVIGDIVESRQTMFGQQGRAQAVLKLALEKIDADYPEYLSADFKVVSGDGFVGLLSEAAYSMRLIPILINELYPFRLRIGIGIGDVRSEINPRDSRDSDGSAFRFARAALNSLKNEPISSFWPAYVPFFRIRFETGTPDSGLLNFSSAYISDIMSSWTERQWATIEAVEKNDNNQSRAANTLGQAKSTVTRSLKAALYSEYLKAIATITGYLEDTYDLTATSGTRLQQALNLMSAADYLLNERIDYRFAFAKYREALSIREKALSAEHPDTARTYNNIAYVYSEQGDYEKAVRCYLKALSIQEKVLGVGHPDTARTYNNIAYVYSEQGDYGKAQEWLGKARSTKLK